MRQSNPNQQWLDDDMQILKTNQSYIKEVDNNIVLHTIKIQTKQFNINIMLDSGSTHTVVNKK